MPSEAHWANGFIHYDILGNYAIQAVKLLQGQIPKYLSILQGFLEESFDSLVYFYITLPNSDYIFLQSNVQIDFLFCSSYLQLESGIYLSFQLTGYFRKFYLL